MAKARWTILTYIAAHNNLAMLGKLSLNQILKIGSTAEVVHGMLYDGPGEGGRYLVGEPGFVSEQETFEEFDAGDPDELIKTALWLFEKCPAERYGLVLWSHGTGWTPEEIAEVAAAARPAAAGDAQEPRDRAAMPGALTLFRTTLRTMQQPGSRIERAILFDDGTGHSLDTLELQRVTSTIAIALGQRLDLLGMDACLMASAEVAFEIRTSVRALVASPELVPGHSWPYETIYGALRSNPEMSGSDLARLVVDRYVEFYTAQPPAAGDVTKVALDLERIEALSVATRDLADALTHEMAAHAPVLWQVQQATQSRETMNGKRKKNKFEYHLWDLGSVAAGLAAHASTSETTRGAAGALTTALGPGGSVLAEGHRGEWFDGTSGMTVYLVPPGVRRVSPYYGQLAFAQQTHWLDMLTKYHELA